MSQVKQFEVKIQILGGKTIVTSIFAENDFKARQILKIQYPQLVSIHYVKPV